MNAQQDTTVSDPYDALPAILRRMVPIHVRPLVRAGRDTPHYRVNRPDYDRLPIDTFLIDCIMGTQGRVPEMVVRIVEPNNPNLYPRGKLTDKGRLLYVCWYKGDAARMLRDAKRGLYRHIVLPDDPRHAGVEAFKIACDTLHAVRGRSPFRDDLLLRSLGVERRGVPDWDGELT